MTTSAPIRQPAHPVSVTAGATRAGNTGSGRAHPVSDPSRRKRLIDRLENLQSLTDLEHVKRRMFEQLGIRVDIAPGFNEVRTMRGIGIQVGELPGLCRKTRASIPAAIRRAMEKRPQIAYELLNANDLLRDA
jgi:hypothetical protein